LDEEGAVKRYKILKQGQVVTSEKPGKYAGWRPGKIFGRLDCASGKRMKKENRVFFLTWDDALREGYRPCKKCKPSP
jgi:DNA/RNA endonuclease YhcR with UshA esterase domain